MLDSLHHRSAFEPGVVYETDTAHRHNGMCAKQNNRDSLMSLYAVVPRINILVSVLAILELVKPIPLLNILNLTLLKAIVGESLLLKKLKLTLKSAKVLF